MIKQHMCRANYNYRLYGIAVDGCYEDEDGRFWITNGEYESEVAYCPVCGKQATTLPKNLGAHETSEEPDK